MGRPTKKAADRLSARINVTLRPEDRKRLDKMAKASRMEPTEWARVSLLAAIRATEASLGYCPVCRRKTCRCP